MRYIVRTLRFEDGNLDVPDEAGWRNWRVVEVVAYEQTRTDSPRVEYLRCLIEDRT